MAIQMLAAWNGYEQHAVYTLPNAEETRLIGLGLARNYTGSVVPPGVRGDAVVFADNTLGYRDDANGGAASPISTGSGSVAVSATVSGTAGVGNVLTAALPVGYQLVSVAWYRRTPGQTDAAAISGATSLTYTQQSADAGKEVFPVIAAAPTASAPVTLVPVISTPLIRAASPFNVAPNRVTTYASLTRMAGRSNRAIGSGNAKMLYVRADNWYMWVSNSGPTNGQTVLVNPGNSVTIRALYVECNGITKQATWSGATSRVVADGAYDILTDGIAATEFGYASSIPKNTPVYLRYELEVAAGGKLVSLEARVETSGYQCVTYDPAAGSVDNLSGTGVLTFTGTTTANSYGPGLGFGLLCEWDYSSGLEPQSWLLAGDSIFAANGYGPQALSYSGTNLIAGYMGALTGSISGGWWNTDDRIQSLVKYCSAAVDEYGTNEIGGYTVSGLQSNSTAMWTMLRSKASTHPSARPFKILRPNLGCRALDVSGTTTAATFDSLSSQVVGPDWEVGGKADQWWTWVQTQAGNGVGPDVVFDPWAGSGGNVRANATFGNSQFRLWALVGGVRSTNDGTHPNSTGVAPLKINLYNTLIANA